MLDVFVMGMSLEPIDLMKWHNASHAEAGSEKCGAV